MLKPAFHYVGYIETTLEELAPATKDAYLELAAAVADGFISQPNRK